MNNISFLSSHHSSAHIEPLSNCFNSFGQLTFCQNITDSYQSLSRTANDSLTHYISKIKAFISSNDHEDDRKISEYKNMGKSAIGGLITSTDSRYSPLNLPLFGELKDETVRRQMLGSSFHKSGVDCSAKKSICQRIHSHILDLWHPMKKLTIDKIGFQSARNLTIYDHPYQFHSDGFFVSRLNRNNYQMIATLPIKEVPLISGMYWKTKSYGVVRIIDNPKIIKNNYFYFDIFYFLSSLFQTKRDEKGVRVKLSDHLKDGESNNEGQSHKRLDEIVIKVSEFIEPVNYSKLRTAIIPGLVNDHEKELYCDKDGCDLEKRYSFEDFYFKHANISKGCFSSCRYLARHAVHLPENETTFFSPLFHIHSIPNYVIHKHKENCTSEPIETASEVEPGFETFSVQRALMVVAYHEDN